MLGQPLRRPARSRPTIAGKKGDIFGSRCPDTDVSHDSGQKALLVLDDFYIKSGGGKFCCSVSAAAIHHDDLDPDILRQQRGDRIN